jgi:hypothetical protein
MFADDQNVSLAPGMRPGRVSANMLDQSGGQVVAGSNPVSPTKKNTALNCYDAMVANTK